MRKSSGDCTFYCYHYYIYMYIVTYYSFATFAFRMGMPCGIISEPPHRFGKGICYRNPANQSIDWTWAPLPEDYRRVNILSRLLVVLFIIIINWWIRSLRIEERIHYYCQSLTRLHLSTGNSRPVGMCMHLVKVICSRSSDITTCRPESEATAAAAAGKKCK